MFHFDDHVWCKSFLLGGGDGGAKARAWGSIKYTSIALALWGRNLRGQSTGGAVYPPAPSPAPRITHADDASAVDQ